ncbi:competence protein CoiA [Vagococcus entomophilus]|uniref:Competence protein CoiA n=1 Tax=Vagococcus entomophilus TaxID=1160095 RepID=A0A430AKX6_9ENTE|nr:competence protein CoiA family protein [Vagococcus entomophilus]RSU08729.1 hypothetical protein CBF30_05755 [Vagococcus entomophilus]
MLLAENEKGQVVSALAKQSSSTRRSRYRCLACHQIVILRAGPHKRAHFAHLRKEACEAYTEGETPEHLLGKQLLKEWCQEQGLSYQLEAYLPDLQQRPDLLIEGHYAIEFQCSPISLEMLLKRTENYKKYGYEVFWMVGEKFFLHSRLPRSTQAFFYYYLRLGYALWELDVHKQQLRLQFHIEHLRRNKKTHYLTKIWQKEKCDLSLKEVLQFPKCAKYFHRRYFSIVEQQRIHYREIVHGLIKKEKKYGILQAYFYQNRQNVRELPAHYYGLCPDFLFMKTDCLIWQVSLWVHWQKSQTVRLHVHTTTEFLLQEIKKGKLEIIQFPNCNLRNLVEDFVRVYLDYLVDCFLLAQLNPHFFYFTSWGEMQKKEPFNQLNNRKILKNTKQLSRIPRKNMIL